MLRQYTITSIEDSINITNGRCPNYALSWSKNDQKLHWPDGHDYFMGNGLNIVDYQELREILSKKLERGTLSDKIIFCDLDGVLADFEQGVFNKFHKPINSINPSLMWGVINKSTTFFEGLPWMPRGRELWKNICDYDPIILTGTPSRCKTAAEQKRKWIAREIGQDIHVITCETKDKPKFCLHNFILIDDRTDNLKSWTDKGGIFFLYNEDSLDDIIERIKTTEKRG